MKGSVGKYRFRFADAAANLHVTLTSSMGVITDGPRLKRGYKLEVVDGRAGVVAVVDEPSRRASRADYGGANTFDHGGGSLKGSILASKHVKVCAYLTFFPYCFFNSFMFHASWLMFYAQCSMFSGSQVDAC
jgi:hypothetical protein